MVPAIVTIGGIFLLLGSFYLLPRLFPDTPARRAARVVEEGGVEREGAELVLTDDTLWFGSRLDLFAGYVPQERIETRRIAVGPSKETTLDFTVKSKKGVQAKLTSPKGASVVTPTKVIQNSDGTVTAFYSIPNNND